MYFFLLKMTPEYKSKKALFYMMITWDMCFFVVVEKHLCKKKPAFHLRSQYPSSNTPQNVSPGFLSPLLLLRLPVCVDESSSAL